jgi:hypothetical protein
VPVPPEYLLLGVTSLYLVAKREEGIVCLCGQCDRNLLNQQSYYRHAESALKDTGGGGGGG